MIHGKDRMDTRVPENTAATSTFIPSEPTVLKEPMMTSVAGNDAGNQFSEKGFTLLELLVVVIILALVLGVSYPSMERASSILNIQTASRDVLNTFRFAREKAVPNNRPCC